jgi:hypothetical protein
MCVLIVPGERRERGNSDGLEYCKSASALSLETIFRVWLSTPFLIRLLNASAQNMSAVQILFLVHLYPILWQACFPWL